VSSAGQFHFPDDPFVLFLYNPFELPVMLQVINNVSVSHRRQPGRIVVTYFTPVHDHLWDKVDFLRRVVKKWKYTIWDTDPDNRGAGTSSISIRL